MKKLFSVFVFVIILSCTKKEGTMVHEDGYYRFLTYGFPNVERDKLKDLISSQWKIKYESVAGCTVTQQLMDSVRAENEKTDLALQKKYGKNWKEKYENDIQEALMKQVDIMDVLITNQMFRKELVSHQIEIDNVEKDAEELDRPDFYKVNIYKDHSTIAFTVNVDIKNRKVNLIK